MPQPARPFVFVWENLGPNHVDRLAAMAQAVGADKVRAVQFYGSSGTYDWDASDVPVSVTTLRERPSTGRRLDLIAPLVRACLAAGPGADVFLCHYDTPPVIATAYALRARGRRVFAMIESKFDDYPRRLRRDAVKTPALWPYHGVIAASRRARDYLAYLGIPRERIALDYSTLSVDRIAALSGEPVAPDGVPFAERDFAIVARLVPKKNLGMALDAFALWLGQTRQPRALHLLGSGPLEAELRDQAARLGIAEHVRFHGFVQTDAVSRQLGRSLCMILTSTEEQFGLVVIEAQAVGLPVLLTANAGAADHLVDNGVNGYVIDPSNPRALAALMLQLSEDEATWRRFATATRDMRYRGDACHFAAGVLALTDRAAERNG